MTTGATRAPASLSHIAACGRVPLRLIHSWFQNTEQ
jgi:hypothetical protein